MEPVTAATAAAESITTDERTEGTKDGYANGGNNRVYMSGTIHSEPMFSHEVFGEGFYEMNMSIPRLSGAADVIPVTMSERLLADAKIYVGKQVAVKGQFRSYNKLIGERSKLMLTMFAREVLTPDDAGDAKQTDTENSGSLSKMTNTSNSANMSNIANNTSNTSNTSNSSNTSSNMYTFSPAAAPHEGNPNIIELTGFICKAPVYRTTPFNREICDILVAVNRAYNKSDYIPAIAWGRNARFAKNMLVGEKVNISGRIQSREYQKRLENGTVETRTAFEVSINKISRDDLESQFSDTDAAFSCED